MAEAIRQGDIPGVQLRVRQSLPVDLDTAWRGLTEPDQLEHWACDQARVEGTPPTGIEWVTATADGGRVVESGTTVRWEPPLLWVVAFRRTTWRAITPVSLELGRVAGEPVGCCELSILHQGFEKLPLSDGLTIWEHYRRRWREATGRLSRHLS